MPSQNVFLDVPYDQIAEVKALGARWNTEKKKWYVRNGVDTASFAPWMGSPQASSPASTSTERIALFVDLVPRSAWFLNLRSELGEPEWALVKSTTFKAAKYRCEVCGGRGPQHPVECHERWEYNDQTNVQTLVRTIALCPACHGATHFGFARIKGKDKEARQQLMRVNGWDDSRVDQHIHEAMAEWERRSATEWQLDARWLLDFIHVSDSTREKIYAHADGLGERKIQDWQRDVINRQKESMTQQRPLEYSLNSFEKKPLTQHHLESKFSWLNSMGVILLLAGLLAFFK